MHILEWLATVLLILTSTVRALNIGFVVPSYLLSLVAYFLVLLDKKTSPAERTRTYFYTCLSAVAVYRWWWTRGP